MKKNSKKLMPLLLSVLVVLCMAFAMTGCGEKKEEPSAAETKVYEDGEVLGEGEKTFPLTVVNSEGESVSLEIHTDKEIVGEALLDLGVIAGEDGDYGLYVKTVNGETVDFDNDGKYWAFYINDEYAMTGVDSTEITEGDSYALKVEK